MSKAKGGAGAGADTSAYGKAGQNSIKESIEMTIYDPHQTIDIYEN